MDMNTILSVVVLAWAGMCIALPIMYITVQIHKAREQERVWQSVKALDDALQVAATKGGDS